MTLTNYKPAKPSIPTSSGTNISGQNKQILGQPVSFTGANLGGLSFKAESPEDILLKKLQIAREQKALSKASQEGKKAFSDTQEKMLMGIYNTACKLNKLADEFKRANYKTGLLWGNVPLDVKQYVRPVKETGFLGELKHQFELYRKDITGVQAGFRELKELKKSFPTETSIPAVLLERIRRTVETNNEIIINWLNFKEAEGYDVSALRKMFQGAQPQGLFDM